MCAIDLLSPTPTNILDEAVWDQVMKDVEGRLYSAVWFATPCNTFSPLRKKPPGPRPVRDKTHVTGLPASRLRPAEKKQLKEANLLVERTVQAAKALTALGLPWGLENPTHGDELSMWDMPGVKELMDGPGMEKADFDQCRWGCETTKPTRFLSHRLNFQSMHEVRCNHPKQEQVRPDGSKYSSSHPSPVQRWRDGPGGQRERASKALGEYTSDLSAVIAFAIHGTQRRGGVAGDRARVREPLRGEPAEGSPAGASPGGGE